MEEKSEEIHANHRTPRRSGDGIEGYRLEQRFPLTIINSASVLQYMYEPKFKQVQIVFYLIRRNFLRFECG